MKEDKSRLQAYATVFLHTLAESSIKGKISLFTRDAPYAE
jgi:hypothetical protein